MIKAVIFLLLLSGIGRLHAQDNFVAPWKSVKLYLNFDVGISSGGFASSFANGSPVGMITPAFSWSRSPRFVHEAGIAALHFNSKARREVYLPSASSVFDYEFVGGWAVTDYQVGLRYELAWKWLDWGHSTLYFGGGLTPFFAKATYKSDKPGRYDALEKTAGVHLLGVFRLLFRLNRHWFADLNVPTGILLSASDFTITQNGTANRNTTSDLGSVMGIRAALGYRF